MSLIVTLTGNVPFLAYVFFPVTSNPPESLAVMVPEPVLPSPQSMIALN